MAEPSRWQVEDSSGNTGNQSVGTPSLSNLIESTRKDQTTHSRKPSNGPVPIFPTSIDLALPGSHQGSVGGYSASSLDLDNLKPPIAKRPREGIQTGAFSVETLPRNGPQRYTGPMEICIGGLIELSTSAEDLKIVEFLEYAVFAM